MAAALVEDALVLRGGDGAARSHPDPDSASGPHGRRVGRVGGDDGHVVPGEHPPLHRHGRRRKGVPVGLDVGQALEEAVGDGEARWRAVVAHSDEHHAGAVVARNVVGERADRLTDILDRAVLAGRSLPERLLALDEIGLEVGHEVLEDRVGVGVGHGWVSRHRSASFRMPRAPPPAWRRSA